MCHWECRLHLIYCPLYPVPADPAAHAINNLTGTHISVLFLKEKYDKISSLMGLTSLASKLVDRFLQKECCSQLKQVKKVLSKNRQYLGKLTWIPRHVVVWIIHKTTKSFHNFIIAYKKTFYYLHFFLHLHFILIIFFVFPPTVHTISTDEQMVAGVTGVQFLVLDHSLTNDLFA